jgi:hypothetical protein
MALLTKFKQEYKYILATATQNDIPDNIPTEKYEYGLEEQAYAKVMAVDGGKEGMLINLTFFTPDRASVLGVRQYRFIPDLFGDNFIAQAYKYLKTMPEYAGAQDC